MRIQNIGVAVLQGFANNGNLKSGPGFIGRYYRRWPFCAAVSSFTSKCRLGLGHCYWLLNTLYVIREQLGIYNQKQKKDF